MKIIALGFLRRTTTSTKPHRQKDNGSATCTGAKMTLDELIESAVAHLDQDRAYEAAEVAGRLLAEFPKEPQVYYLSGLVAQALGDFERAIAAFRAANRLEPNFPMCWFALAKVHLAQGDTDRTVQALEETLRLSIVHKEATNLLTQLYLELGRRRRAVEVAKLGLATDPSDEKLRERLVELTDNPESQPEQPAAGKLAPSNDLVVLICEIPRAREKRLAEANRYAGLRAVLLYRSQPQFDNIGDYFDETHLFRTCWQAVEIASRYTPIVYHVCNIFRTDTAAALIIARLGKVIVDCYA